MSDSDVTRVFDDAGTHGVGEDVEGYADLTFDVFNGKGLGAVVSYSARAVQHFVETLSKAAVRISHVLG